MVRATLLILVTTCVLAGGCSSSEDDRAYYAAKDLSCDRDEATSQAKDTIERVGGYVAKDYKVTFAQSTRAGVVALVDRNASEAFDELDGYGVAIVAQKDHDRVVGRTNDFGQVRALVEAACTE